MRHWHLQNSPGTTYTPDEAQRLLHNRLSFGTQETRFEDPEGRVLAVVTNADRALVVLYEDGASQHLIEPEAQGESQGFLLGNGQVDAYANRDTVPFATAARALAHFMAHGTWPDDVTVEDD